MVHFSSTSWSFIRLKQEEGNNKASALFSEHSSSARSNLKLLIKK